MKIGFMNHPRKDLIKELEWIGKNGFDFVDLFLEEDKAVPEKIKINKVKKILKKYKLDIVGHTAWYLPIGSPIKAFREDSIKEAERYFKIFKKLNVKYVTIHAYWPPSLFSDEEGIKFQIDSLRRLVEIAKKYEIRIMFELADNKQDNLKNIAKILKKVPSLYFHLDIGHTNLQKGPIEFIKKFHKKIKHVHLHDNHGEEDEHLEIGQGNINWSKVIKVLKKYYDGTITLELFLRKYKSESKKKKALLKNKDKLRKLWEKC